MALPCHLKWKPLHVPQICCVSRYLLCLSKSSQVICPVFLSSGRWASFSSQIALGSLQELFPLTGMRPDNTSVRLPFSYDSYLVLNIIPHKYPTYQPFVKQHLTTLNSQLDSMIYWLIFRQILMISNEFISPFFACPVTNENANSKKSGGFYVLLTTIFYI